MKRILFILLFGFAAIPMLFAGPVRVSFKDTTMVRGSTVYIPVRVDSSLTGLNVFSYELDISYTTSGALIDTAVATGSMTSGWLPPVYHLSPGRITISSAGTSALTGTGFLLFIRVKLPLSGTAGATSLTLNKAMFNEGTPATALRSGTIIITNPPSITVNPNTALLTVGDTQQFSVSGATPPITWSSTSPSIGSINASGLLSALSAGFCRVVAVDVNGTRDTNQQVEIRACRLSVRDTTYRQGQTFLLPVYISNLSAVDIFSGTFTLSYNANVLTATGASHTGTLLGPSGAPTIDINSGSITVAFASAARLNGVGQQVLVYIQFLVTSVNTYGTSLTFSNMLLNESLPANNVNAGFSPISTSSLTVSPNTATLVAGDSLQFSVSGGAVNPVIWSTSNPSLAAISATGMLKALASGTIQVSAVDANTNTGKSGTITLYDIRLQLPAISSAAGFIVDQTFSISGFPPGIYSAQFQVNFNSTYFTPVSVSTGGTLASSWMMALDSPSPGIASIAGAGSQPVTSAGLLLRLRFQIANNAPAGFFPIALTNTMLNEGKPLALITHGSISISPTAVTQSLLTGWNMVSIPLNMTDMRKTTLYPTATTKAYSYNGTYLMPDTLQNRLGYWLKFSSPLSKQLAGSPRSRDTISVRANGWNMIGSVAYPIPKSAIVHNPPANTISAYYAYVPGSGYQIRDTIKPGVGYWIKTLNAGNLILDFANVPPAIVEKSEASPNTLNELTIRQLLATGEESEPSRLYFGEQPAPADRMEEFELPPLPPPGCFDVRFASNRYVAHLSAEKGELPILMQSEGNGIKIAWSVVSAPGVPFVLVEKKDGKVVAERELSSGGSMWIGDPEGVTLSLTIRRRPAEFSLSQNYPNPFNPVTVIRYNLPARQDNILSYNVSLRIYNMLGQLVATVVDEAQSSGSKTVTFDAGNLASGMYIYKLTAGTFSGTRKMVLLR